MLLLQVIWTLSKIIWTWSRGLRRPLASRCRIRWLRPLIWSRKTMKMETIRPPRNIAPTTNTRRTSSTNKRQFLKKMSPATHICPGQHTAHDTTLWTTHNNHFLKHIFKPKICCCWWWWVMITRLHSSDDVIGLTVVANSAPFWVYSQIKIKRRQRE